MDKNLPRATSTAPNPPCTFLGLNPSLNIVKPATDRLSYCTTNTFPTLTLLMCEMAAVFKFPACLKLNSIAVQS
jgi:hypothetical protein